MATHVLDSLVDKIVLAEEYRSDATSIADVDVVVAETALAQFDARRSVMTGRNKTRVARWVRGAGRMHATWYVPTHTQL